MFFKFLLTLSGAGGYSPPTHPIYFIGLKCRWCAHPDKFCRTAACIFNKMIPIRPEIKTLTGFYHIAFVSKMQSDPPGNHYPILPPHVVYLPAAAPSAVQLPEVVPSDSAVHWARSIGYCCPLHQFSQKSTFGIYDMFLLRLFEKFRRCRSETLNQIQQCHHGRCHLATLQLGYISFGQFRPVCQFLLVRPFLFLRSLIFSPILLFT